MGDIDLCRAVAVRVGLDRSVLRVILTVWSAANSFIEPISWIVPATSVTLNTQVKLRRQIDGHLHLQHTDLV